MGKRKPDRGHQPDEVAYATPTKATFANAYSMIAERIREHLQLNTPGIETHYPAFWYLVNEWSRRAKEHLGAECPDLGDVPGGPEPGANWHADYCRIAAFCEKAAELLERDLVAIEEVAVKLGRSIGWVQKRIEAGELRSYRRPGDRKHIVSLSAATALLHRSKASD